MLGSIYDGTFTNNSGGYLEINGKSDQARDNTYTICSGCSTPESEPPTINFEVLGSSGAGPDGSFSGAVECSSQGGGGNTTTTQPSSSSMTGTSTTQDSDGDGVSDSSDRCTHNSNPRCFKEGGDTSTTTHEQEQPPSTSSNNRTGNQTR